MRDNNSEIIAVSGEGYSSQYNCQRAIRNVKGEAHDADVHNAD